MQQEVWFTSEGRRKTGVSSVVIEAHQLRKDGEGYVLHLTIDGRHKKYFLAHNDIECVEDLTQKYSAVAC